MSIGGKAILMDELLKGKLIILFLLAFYPVPITVPDV